MLQITEGVCSVFGLDPAIAPEKVHALSGVVTERAQMYNNLSGLQNLEFFAALFGIGAEESRRRALELLERLELIDAKDQKLAEYSTGMRQRLSLARAMIHRPRILFLDEPASGLDPESAQSVNNLIKSLAREKGTTVFLCTHQLRYAEEICTSYGLISEGSMLAAGTLDELRSLVFSGMTVMVKASGGPKGIFTRHDGEFLTAGVDSEEEIPGLVKRIVDGGGRVYHVSSRRLSLEEIYFALIDKLKNDKGKSDAQ
jgi:ABC-2 type transport system ATP-binding protein